MSAEPKEVAVITKAERAEQRKLIPRFAERYGVDADKLLVTLKNTAFRLRDGEVSVEQMMALLIVAEAHKLNPFTREIFAFPSQGGVVPVVSVDGWAKLANDHPQFDGMDFVQTDEACTCTIHRKDRKHPVVVTEYMIECKRDTGPWKTHPKRMLRHKAMIQCARLAFSFAGVFDPDEAEAIVQAEIDVTPGNEVLPGENKDGKVSPKRLREVVEGLLAAVEKQDGPALLAIYNDLTSEQQLYVWDQLRSWERSGIKKLRDSAMAASCGVDLDKWSIEALRGAPDPAKLEGVWRDVQDSYAENDATVPGDVETCYIDRKAELGA